MGILTYRNVYGKILYSLLNGWTDKEILPFYKWLENDGDNSAQWWMFNIQDGKKSRTYKGKLEIIMGIARIRKVIELEYVEPFEQITNLPKVIICPNAEKKIKIKSSHPRGGYIAGNYSLRTSKNKKIIDKDLAKLESRKIGKKIKVYSRPSETIRKINERIDKRIEELIEKSNLDVTEKQGQYEYRPNPTILISEVQMNKKDLTIPDMK